MSQDQTPAQNGSELPGANMTDDQVLAYTRGLRVKVINTLMPGDAVPGDNSDRIMLSQMISGLESQAISSKRIAADQKNSDNTAAVVAELLRGINRNSPFKLNPNSNIVDVDARVVPNTVPDIPALPGEMDVAPPQLDYASFVRSQGKDVDQLGKDVRHAESDDEDDIP
jgi:hypothetical protein